MRRSSPVLSLCRLCSSGSASDAIRGLQSLLTPKERQAQRERGAGATAAAAQYQEAKKGDKTEAILAAQRARRERMLRDYDGEYEASGGGGVTNIALEAQFAQLEREGAFKNLAGSGKPLPERVATHFGDEDAVDRMMGKIMADNNVRPESVELRLSYMAKLKTFRTDLAAGAGAAHRDGRPLRREGYESEIDELHALRRAFDDASIKDSFIFSLPISKLPRVASLNDELSKLPSPRLRQ